MTSVCEYDDDCNEDAVRRFGGEWLCPHHYRFMSYGVNDPL